MMSCMSHDGDGNDKHTNDAGVPNNHVFSIIDTMELKQDGKDDVKLIQIRNPWGSEMYKASWSDKDKSWTEELKKQANLVVADDGLWWISADEF